MIIEVNNVGGKTYIAVVKENDSITFTSNRHPRPGCAARDALNYVHFAWGGKTAFIQLELKEWK